MAKRAREEASPWADRPLPEHCLPSAVSGRLYPPCILPPAAVSPTDVTAGENANTWLCTSSCFKEEAWGCWARRKKPLFPSPAQPPPSCPLAACRARLTPESLGGIVFFARVPASSAGAGAGAGGSVAASSSSGFAGGGGGGDGPCPAGAGGCVPPSRRILFLDIDETLIRSPGSGWEWKYDITTTQERVREYTAAGFKVVLVSNQCLIKESAETARATLSKMQTVAERLDVPCQVFLATHQDFCYKPYPGIFWLLASLCNAGVPIDAPRCLFVGDAVGRTADHSLADLGFAFNIGAPCTTPEAFFGGSQRPVDVRPILFLRSVAQCAPGDVSLAQEVLTRAGIPVPSQQDIQRYLDAPRGDRLLRALETHFLPPLHFPPPGSEVLVSSASSSGTCPAAPLAASAGGGSSAAPLPLTPPPWASVARGAQRSAQQEVILLCGPPASGKSTLALSVLPTRAQGYERISQDELGTLQRFKEAASQAYEGGHRVVVDKTLTRVKDRLEALEHVFSGHHTHSPQGGIRVLALHKDALTQQRCIHANHVRAFSPLSLDRRGVPDTVVRTYVQQYEMPELGDAGGRVSTLTTWRSVWGSFGVRCAGGCADLQEGGEAPAEAAAAAVAEAAQAAQDEEGAHLSQATQLDEEDRALAASSTAAAECEGGGGG